MTVWVDEVYGEAMRARSRQALQDLKKKRELVEQKKSSKSGVRFSLALRVAERKLRDRIDGA